MKTPGSLSELIFLVEEAPEGGFTARALGKSQHFGLTREVLIERLFTR